MKSRNIIIASVIIIAASVVSLGTYAATATSSETEIVQDTTINQNKSEQVIIYASNNKEKIIKEVSPTTKLIPIYQNGDWVKVGNPKDGSVGWINKKQYNDALNAFYQPDIQTIFVSTSTDKNNKPQINVVAYKNGKAVSKEEADKLYQQLKQQQASQAKQWKNFNHEMLQFQKQMFN
ncbi:hypothetical protein L3V86_07810 [Thiotrichales bacterium 19S11-10]|nr:hypothetical protein [Thiotrichales bacterium 19S11-10]